MKLRAVCGILCSVLLFGSACAEFNFTPDYADIARGSVRALTPVHDPSIIAANGRYYIFGTHMAAAVSDDLRKWKKIANGYSADNPVWGDLFGEMRNRIFAWAGGPNSLTPTDDGAWHVWAPDVIYNKTTSQYMMYYSCSSTWNTSNICYAVSDRVDGPYTWAGTLVCSGITSENMEQSGALETVDQAHITGNYLLPDGSYDFNRWPNAIDPTVFYDADDRLWMVYGSWSGGIFLLELDPATGLVIHPEPSENVDPYFGRHLLGGGHKSMEGPYILYDDGMYYLFVSYGALQAHGGYQIRVFRSESVEGPYTDMNGKTVTTQSSHAGYGLKLSGNYQLPSVSKAYMATGHNSAFVDADGKRYVCYHTRFNNGSENFLPMVKQYLLNREGWPCLLPYSTRGETASDTGYDRKEIAGRYYVINQKADISDAIAEPFVLYLMEDGTVCGQNTQGTWSAEEGTCFMTVTLGSTTFSGVFCAMEDDAGTPVFCFSAAGNNRSVWGVKYHEQEP